MKWPFVRRKTWERDMQYAKAAIDALKKRYTHASMRTAMLAAENRELRKQLAIAKGEQPAQVTQ